MTTELRKGAAEGTARLILQVLRDAWMLQKAAPLSWEQLESLSLAEKGKSKPMWSVFFPNSEAAVSSDVILILGDD